MKHSSSLIHVAEPSGKLPPPLPDSKAHGPMLPSAGMHGGFPPAQTLHPGHMGVLPGIDPNIWANLSPDQRLNLAMNQLVRCALSFFSDCFHRAEHNRILPGHVSISSGHAIHGDEQRVCGRRLCGGHAYIRLDGRSTSTSSCFVGWHLG